MIVHESEEMYLETILRLKSRGGNVRAVDVASELKYSRASVSVAMGNLQKKGYILVEEGGSIRLTKEGKEKAENIYERHQVITELLMRTGAPLELAEDNACRIEHVITEEMFEYIKKFGKNS